MNNTLSPSTFGIAEEDGAGPPPLDLLGLLRRAVQSWKLALAIFVLFVLAASGLLRVLPPRYVSSAQVLVFDPQRPSPAHEGMPEEVGFDTVAMNTQIEVMQSLSLAQRVAQRLHLEDDPEFQKRPQFVWLRRLIARLGPYASYNVPVDGIAPPPPSREERIAEAATLLRAHIKVDRLPLSYLLNVSAKSSSPVMAQRIAKAVVEEYLDAQREGQRTALTQVAAWLNGKLAELQAKVSNGEAALEKLKAANGITDSGKGSLIEQQIADLNTQLLAVSADVAEKRARLQQGNQPGADVSMPSTAAGSDGNAALSQLRLQRSILSRQVEGLRERLGAHHAQVLAMESQLNGIDKAIADSTTRLIAELQNAYEIALARKVTIETSLARLEAQRAGSDTYAQLQELQRGIDGDKKLYEMHLERLNAIETSRALDTREQRIVSPAGLPNAPSFPSRTMFLAGGGFLGVVVGLGAALVLAFLRRPLIGPRVDWAFGNPVLAALPLASPRGNRGGEQDPLHLQRLLQKPSVVGQAMRRLRVELLRSRIESTGQVVAVTASQRGEGVSTVATLLAASFAGAQQRTLLLDCTLAGNPGEPARAGLTELLSGEVDIAAVRTRSQTVGADVISIGLQPRAAYDLLASPRMRSLLDLLRSHYEHVIVDTPSVLPNAETLALATMADKVLMVVDDSRCSGAEITEALRMMRRHHRAIVGLIVNKVEMPLARHERRADRRTSTQLLNAASAVPRQHRPRGQLQRFNTAQHGLLKG